MGFIIPAFGIALSLRGLLGRGAGSAAPAVNQSVAASVGTDDEPSEGGCMELRNAE